MFLGNGNGAPVSEYVLQQDFAEGKKKPRFLIIVKSICQGMGCAPRPIGVKSQNPTEFTMRILNIMALTTAFALPFGLPALAEVGPTITVTGEGSVASAPDMATISLGVTTQADTAAAAMTANSTALTAVLDRLKSAGIAARDMQTSNLTLNPNWVSYDSGNSNKIDGYTASNQLTVQVRALDTLGTVLDSSITDGANTLNGVTFGISEPRPFLDEARKKAVADAVARATLLVAAAGAKLGPIVSITESSGFATPMPMYRMEADAASSVPTAGGEVGLTATVTMVFEITK